MQDLCRHSVFRKLTRVCVDSCRVDMLIRAVSELLQMQDEVDDDVPPHACLVDEVFEIVAFVLVIRLEENLNYVLQVFSRTR